MAIDLNGLSSKELKTLATQIKKQQTALTKRKPIAGVRKKLIALAKAAGYSITELFGSAKSAPAKKVGKPAAKKATRKAAKKPAKKTSKKAVRKAVKKTAKKTVRKGRTGAKVAPKYRNPADPKVTWTGRGRQPLWFADLLKKGKKAEELLIK
jgi:DNA-binding protein H-NS